MSTRTLAQETREFLPVDVTVDGATTTAFEVSVARSDRRPTVWLPAIELEGKHGVVVGVGTTMPLHLGRATVWVRITDTPEQPVIVAGYLTVI